MSINEFSKMMDLYSQVYLKEQDENNQQPTIDADDIQQKLQPQINKVNQEAEKEEDFEDEIEFEPDVPFDLTKLKKNEEQSLGTWTYKALDTAIERAYVYKKSLLIFGDPGIGKSSKVVQYGQRAAKEKGKEFINWRNAPQDRKDAVLAEILNERNAISKYFIIWDLRGIQLQPEDLQGIPDISDKSPFLKTKQPLWVWLFSLGEADGILFLDEMNQASEQMLNAMFEVTLDRSAGGTTFSNQMAIIAAGNLGEEFGNNPIPPALMDRFTAGTLVLDPDQWLDYAYSAGMDGRILTFVTSEPRKNLGMVNEGGEEYTRKSKHKKNKICDND